MAGLLLFSVISVLYLVNAWQLSRGQFVLCLCVPLYIVYFSYIKSQKPSAYRFMILGSIFAICLPNILYCLIYFYKQAQ